MNTLPLAVLLLGVATLSQPASAPAEKVAVHAVVKGNTEFALELHQQLRQRPGNICYSPWSISTVLAMTSAGAQGRTLEQLNKTLHLPPAQLTHTGVAALLRQMKVQNGYELNAANAMFVGKDIPWRKEFLELTRTHYGSSIFTTNFQQQPDTARRSINGWVEGQTRQRIRNLIPAGAVNAETKIVLVNAIYFKGQWAKPFSKVSTVPTPFFRTPIDSVQTPMMSQSDSFLYGENAAVQVLGMPYKGGDLMMIFILPRQRNGLAALEKDLVGGHFQAWLARLEFHPTVDVFLPRFRMTYEFDLERTLAAMGMSELFTSQSNLGGMAANYPLKVDAVIHKAFLELQEEGTEAAAATAVIAMPGAAPGARFTPPPPRPVFRADHPFLFSIVDRRSGSLLFVGRVSDPTK